MATVEVHGGEVTVRFRPLEKIWALRGDLTFPASAITGITVVEDGLQAVRGLRAPGLGIPGRRLCGTFRGRGRKELVSVRRGQPALRVELRGQPYDAVVVGLDHPDVVAAELERLRT